MFEARYRSICNVCENPINPGDQADWLDGEVVHLVCPGIVQRPVGKICPSCFMEMPATGVCDACA